MLTFDSSAMKKVIAISLLSLAFNAFGQRISGPTQHISNQRALPALPVGAFFFEGFENAQVGALPSEWSTTSNGDDGFYTGISGNQPGQANENGYWPVPKHTVYAMTNDDVCNCDKSNDLLTSRKIDLRSLTEVYIGFEAFQNGAAGQNAEIQISKDGVIWTTLIKLNTSNRWSPYERRVPEEFLTLDFQFRFYYSDQGLYASGLAVDNIYLRTNPLNGVESQYTYAVNGSDTQSITLYEGIPLSQARKSNFRFGTDVTNNSDDTLDLKLTIRVNNDFKDTSFNWTVFPNETQTIKTRKQKSFSPFSRGTYNIFYQLIETASDSNVSPIDASRFEVNDSLFHRVKPVSDGTGIWLESAPDQVGTYFQIFTEDTIRAARIDIHPASVANSRIKLNVFSAEDLDTAVYTSAALQIPAEAIGGEVFRIPIDTLLPTGKYLFSIQKVIGTVVLATSGAKSANNAEVLFKNVNQAWKSFPYYPFLSLVYDAMDENCNKAIMASVSQESCFNTSDASIIVDESKFSSSASFNWSNGSTGSSLVNLSPGSYSLTVTDDDGCIYIETIDIEAIDSLQLSALISPDFCDKGKGSLGIEVDGGTEPFNYLLNGVSVSNNISDLSQGTYSIEIIDAKGCSKTEVITISGSDSILVSPNLTQPECNASNGSISLNVAGSGPFDFNWSNGDTLSSAAGLTSGVYQVSISDSLGCVHQERFFLNDSSSVEIVSANSNNETCADKQDGSIDLNITGGSSPLIFQWSNGASTEDIAGIASGEYAITITDNQGCKSFYHDTVNLTHPPMQVDLAEEGVFCAEDKGKITALVSGGVQPYTFNWSNGSNQTFIDSLNADAYIITITDQNGCTKSLSSTIDSIQALSLKIDSVSIKTDSNGFVNASIFTNTTGGTPQFEYLWNTGSNSMHLLNIDSGQYTLTITDQFGCFATLSKYVSSDLNSIQKIKPKKGLLNIFPNPTKGDLIVQSKRNDLSSLGLYTLDGKLLTNSFVNISEAYSINFGSDVTYGMYFLKIEYSSGEIEFQKVLLVR